MLNFPFNLLCGFYLLVISTSRSLQDEKDLTQRRFSIVRFEDARATWKRMWPQGTESSDQLVASKEKGPQSNNHFKGTKFCHSHRSLKKGHKLQMRRHKPSTNLIPTIPLSGPFHYHRDMPYFCQLYTWNIVSFLHTFYTRTSSSKSVTIPISPKL